MNIHFWLKQLGRLSEKNNITFNSVYHAIGGITSFDDKVVYVRKFSEIDKDFGKTLRCYARREYKRTGDGEIEIEWIKAIQKVEGELEFKNATSWK